jgi:8-oxo-dGTP diphosphatase
MVIRNNLTFTKVAVGCLVNKNQEILIAKRAKNKLLAGFWEFPGGKLEAGESYRHALYRELKEEIGISLKQDTITFLMAKTVTYEDRSYNLEFFLCTEWAGQVRALEAQQLAWQKIYDLTEVIMLEGNLEIVELLINLARLNKI